MTAEPKQLYQQAMQVLSGAVTPPGPDDFKRAYEMMQKSAQTFPPARARLAAMQILEIGNSEDGKTANTLFLQAAMDGFSPALRGLGVILLLNKDTAPMGAGLLRRAVQAGDWIAAFLIVRQAQQGRYFASKAELSGLAGQLSGAVPFRAELIASIDGLSPEITPLPLTPFYKAVCEDALNQALKMPKGVSAEIKHQDPLISLQPGVLSGLECDYLIALSCALMQPSKVVDSEAASAKQAGFRTSEGAVLTPAFVDFPAALIIRKLSHAANIRPQQGEFLSLLRYLPGQEYRPHHDYLDEDAQDYSKVMQCGQRSHTLLTYLNEPYGGGETEFPQLGVKTKGAAGDALMFENIDKKGHPIPKSLHAGLPVVTGEKWLATLWCREKTFWPWKMATEI